MDGVSSPSQHFSPSVSDSSVSTMEHSNDDDDDVLVGGKAFPQYTSSSWPPAATTNDDTMKYVVKAFTVICILVIQFRGTISSWIRHLRLVGVISVFWELLDVTSFHLHAVLDMIKVIIQSCFSTELDVTAFALQQRRRASLAMSSVPDLVEIIKAPTDDVAQRDGADESMELKKSVKERRLNQEELEPAFLRDEDYPPTWMVYDRELGVILKTEADKRRQLKETCRETATPIPEVALPAVAAT